MNKSDKEIIQGLVEAVEKVGVKVDLLFGAYSNQTLAQQAVEAANSVHKQAKAGADGPDEAAKAYLDKLQQIFTEHQRNVSDSIDYYIRLYGEETNEKVVKLMDEWNEANPEPEKTPLKDAYQAEQKEPAPVANIKVNASSRKSEKVED